MKSFALALVIILIATVEVFAQSKENPTDDPFSKNYEGKEQTALMRALQDEVDHNNPSGSSDKAEALLDAGVDVRARDNNGQDALMIALQHWQNRKLVRKILDLNPDLTIADKYGNTSLMHALMAGENELAAKLIKAGARVDVVNKSSQTLLHFAARNYNLELIELLLANKLDIHAVDENGDNVIHYMARFLSDVQLDFEHTEQVLKALGGAKADLNLTNAMGAPPFIAQPLTTR